MALVEVNVAQVDADEAQQQPARVYAEDFPEAVVDGVANFFHKPRLRGWIHVYSAIVAFIAGAALVSVSWSVVSTRAGIATLIYTLTIVAMFAVSGAYHRVDWKSATARKWMKRARSLDDLRVHRGQLHAVRAAGAAGVATAWCCCGSSGPARSPACC